MFLKIWSSTGWQVFWALRSTGLRKGGTRWGTWRKLCKKSWLAWPANSCLTIYARLEEEKWEIMTMVQAQEKGKIDNEGGEFTTRHMHKEEREWCQINWVNPYGKHQIIRAVGSSRTWSETLQYVDLEMGSKKKKNFERGGGSTILFPMQMIYDELPAC